MEEELSELQKKIKEYVNKYNIKESRVDIMDLYKKKKVDVIVK